MTIAPVFLSSRQMIGLSSMKIFGGWGRKDCEYRAFPAAPTLAVHCAPNVLRQEAFQSSQCRSNACGPITLVVMLGTEGEDGEDEGRVLLTEIQDRRASRCKDPIPKVKTRSNTPCQSMQRTIGSRLAGA